MYLKMRLKKTVFVLLALLMVICTPLSVIGQETYLTVPTLTTITWDNPIERSLGPLSTCDIKVTLKDSNGYPLKNKGISPLKTPL